MGMIEEIRDLWTADLLSGNYPQTSGALCRATAWAGACTCDDEIECECDATPAPAGFCCLGVLCEQAVTAGVAERTVADSLGRIGYRRAGSDDDPDYDVLPLCVSDWAGLFGANPPVSHMGRTVRLSVVNDDRKESFEIIAGLVASL